MKVIAELVWMKGDEPIEETIEAEAVSWRQGFLHLELDKQSSRALNADCIRSVKLTVMRETGK